MSQTGDDSRKRPQPSEARSSRPDTATERPERPLGSGKFERFARRYGYRPESLWYDWD